METEKTWAFGSMTQEKTEASTCNKNLTKIWQKSKSSRQERAKASKRSAQDHEQEQPATRLPNSKLKNGLGALLVGHKTSGSAPGTRTGTSSAVEEKSVQEEKSSLRAER
jgi:hypothetical protein